MTREAGIGIFGLLIVLAIAAAIAYYTYKGITGADAPPSCASAFTSCMQKCRRNSTEAPAAQACQEDCQRDQAACERK